MSIGSTSVILPTLAQVLDQLHFEVKAGHVNATLLELNLHQTAGNTFAGRIGRSTGSIPSVIQQCFPENSADGTLFSFITTAWSVLPAVNKIGLRRALQSGTTGVVWIFPRGFKLPAHTGLGAWSASTATSSGTTVIAVIEE